VRLGGPDASEQEDEEREVHDGEREGESLQLHGHFLRDGLRRRA